MLKALRRPHTRTNPIFYEGRVERLLGHDPERIERMRTEPDNLDLLTWNVFESLDSEPDREYLAALLQPFAGNDARAPVHVVLWTGRHREPFLRPSTAYIHHIKEKAGDGAGLDEFTRPIEAPVRIETPSSIALVDTTIGVMPQGAGGRDRLVELVDAGLEHARHLSKTLTVAVVYRSGTEAAGALSARINQLRAPERLAEALPWRARVPEVRCREVSWQELLRVWEHEREHFSLSGEPVREFLEYAASLGLR